MLAAYFSRTYTSTLTYFLQTHPRANKFTDLCHLHVHVPNHVLLHSQTNILRRMYVNLVDKFSFFLFLKFSFNHRYIFPAHSQIRTPIRIYRHISFTYTPAYFLHTHTYISHVSTHVCVTHLFPTHTHTRVYQRTDIGGRGTGGERRGRKRASTEMLLTLLEHI